MGVEKGLVLAIIVIFLATAAHAVECGTTPTDGCTISTSTTFDKGTYNLPNGVVITNPNVILDCNDATLVMNDFFAISDISRSGGIQVGSSDVTIRNCNLEDYLSGIRIFRPTESTIERLTIENNVFTDNGNGLYVIESVAFEDSIIRNNIFSSQTGILLDQGVRGLEITQNVFSNDDFGFIQGTIDSGHSIIVVGNTFNDLGINAHTNGPIYCQGGIDNTFNGDAKGPSCECFPADYLSEIHGDITICPGDYDAGQIEILADSTVDCQGASFIGRGDNRGFQTLGEIDFTIENCKLSNYETALDVGWVGSFIGASSGTIRKNTIENNVNGIRFNSDDDSDALIENNIIRNNDVGFTYTLNGKTATLRNNDITSTDGILARTANADITAVNNYWGLSAASLISDRIRDSRNTDVTGTIIFEPFSTEPVAGGDVINPGDDITDGMIITSSLTLENKIYNLPNGVSIGAADVVIDCNGGTLQGSADSNIGILNSFGGVVIRDCIIQDYDIGIKQECGFFNTFNEISGNTIVSNNQGVVMETTDNCQLSFSSIFDNSFNNDNEDVSLIGPAHASHSIYSNNFAGEGIYYDHTGIDVSYCQGSLTNTYTSNAMGPECDCIIPYNSLIVQENTNLCSGNYHLQEGVMLQSSEITLDCNDATLRGPNDGITISGGSNSVVDCNLEDFRNGIRVMGDSASIRDIVFEDNSVGLRVEDESSGLFVTGSVFDSTIGILPGSQSSSYNLEQNEFISGVFVQMEHSQDLPAANNWWGSTSTETIHLSITDCQDSSVGCVLIDPILTEPLFTFGDDIILEKITFDDRSFDVSVGAHITSGLSGSVAVRIMHTRSGSLISEVTVLASLGGEAVGSTPLDLQRGDVIHVLVDPENAISESNEENNALSAEYVGGLNYYIAVDTPPEKATEEVTAFIRDNLRGGVIVENRDDADVLITIARHNPLMVWHFETLEEQGWGFHGGALRYKDETCARPYCGLIGNIYNENRKEIYLEANDIDGFIATAKRFIEKQELFLNGDFELFLGEDDADAVSVYDYLHTGPNRGEYKQNTEKFRSIVRNALYGRTFESTDSSIFVDGNELRIRHLEPVKSTAFRSYADPDGFPVVLAGGLWSDITAWESLGWELSDSGYDVYLLEITGGPGLDCTDCIDYTYSYLTDVVYPAYIEEILRLTGKSKIKYVGHSNGARVALDSLANDASLAADVDTLVLVGVPGAFEGELGVFGRTVRDSGHIALDRMEKKGLRHVTFSNVAHNLESASAELLAIFFRNRDPTISWNLFSNYYNWISSVTDSQPGLGLAIDYFTMIYSDNGILLSNVDDTIVPISDPQRIFENVESSNNGKKISKVHAQHEQMLIDKNTYRIIQESLSKQLFSEEVNN